LTLRNQNAIFLISICILNAFLKEKKMMVESRQTTIRFGDILYRRLEEASERTGLPINSIVIVACMEWLKTHESDLDFRKVSGKEPEIGVLKKHLAQQAMKMRMQEEVEGEPDKIRAERKRLQAEFEELGRLRAEKKRLMGELEQQKRLAAQGKHRTDEPEEPEIEE
jgi:hypothetical protein